MENRIKVLRIEKGLTQSDLAKIIGKKRTTIAAYEQETISPSQPTLILLAQYFGVTADYIIGKTDIRHEIPTSRDIYYTMQTIIDILRCNEDVYFDTIKLSHPQKCILQDILQQNLAILRKIIQDEY